MYQQPLFPGRTLGEVLLISRRTLGCPVARHYGVMVPVAGRYVVYHFGEDSKVHHEPLESFLRGYQMCVHEVRSMLPYEPVLNTSNYGYRAPKYDLWTKNCEHFARWAFSGKEESHQIQLVTIAAVGILATRFLR